jgi:hypothetical protein
MKSFGHTRTPFVVVYVRVVKALIPLALVSVSLENIIAL